MDGRTFKIWACGCAHVNTDKKMGRDSLREAIIDSEKYFNWSFRRNSCIQDTFVDKTTN